MPVQLRLFATFRDAVGAKTAEREAAGTTVGDLLADLVAEHPELDLFDDAGELHPHVHVLVNGRGVEHLDGLGTSVEDGDTVGLFPPVEGG